MSYVLVRNATSRHVRMTLTPDGLRVSVPARLADDEVLRAVASRERWLLRHRDLLAPAAPDRLEDGMALPFLDGEITLCVQPGRRSAVAFRPDEGRVDVRSAGTDDVRALVERGYRAAAREWFAWACSHHGGLIGARPVSIAIRDPRTRWGSCSPRGAVAFSWRLLMAPARVAEYVVVHELAHLVHLNHSPAFWNLVNEQRPDHREESEWLRHHGRWLSRAPGTGPRPAAP